MIGLIRFGNQASPINMGEYMLKCPTCECDTMADVMIVSHYFHIWYLPMFPTGKEANIICQTCHLKRYGAGFNSKVFKNYKEIRHLYRHPWFEYIGVGIIALILLATIIIDILK